MIGKRYQIKEPTLGMVQSDGHHASVTIPIGSIIVVTGGPVDGNRLVDVTWNDRPFMMFARDLRSRGELIEDVA